MKKLLSIFAIIILCAIMVLSLTGCGKDKEDESSKKTDAITKELNNIVDSEVKDWKERGYGRMLSISFLQSELEENESKYTIVASGDAKFTKAPENKEYKEEISNYDGNSYSIMRMMEKSATVNYIVVYDTKAEKYYNVELEYKEVNLDGAKKEYPVFKNAKEIK